MKFNSHEYQDYATKFILEHPACAVLLDMGLGKTVITLMALKELILETFEIGRVLIIAPKRVALTTWPAEIEKWDDLDGLSYSVAVGSADERRHALQRAANVYITNRDCIDWMVNDSGISFDFDMVIVDELSCMKTSRTKRFRSLLKVRPMVKRFVGLSGTPAPNSLLDLWSEYRLIDGDGSHLGKFIGWYRSRFFIPDKRNASVVFSYKPREGAEEEIYKKIGDITISMKSTDYLDMPELVTPQTVVRMSPEEREKYDTLKKEMVVDLNGREIDAMNAAVLSNKLLQLAAGACYTEDHEVIRLHERKLDALEDIVEAANGAQVLVAYNFKHDLDGILRRFPTARVLKEPKDVRDWNDGRIQMMCIHPMAAGHGLNLQQGGAHIMVWYTLTWSLELYQQTNARLWRQGQKSRTVTIQHIVMKDSIDDAVMQALERKDHTQDALIRAVRAEVTAK